MIDYGNLRPLLVPRGTPVEDEDRLRALGSVLDGDSGWVEVGLLRPPAGYTGPRSGAECAGVGAWALARGTGTPALTVQIHYAHSPEQLARHDELVALFRRDGIEIDDGRPVETVVGRGEHIRVLAAYEGYPDDAAAVHDARRIVLLSVLERGVVTRACGWGDSCVITARGYDWSTFRTWADGRVDTHITQGAMEGIACYARTVMELAAEHGPGIPQAWLYREAAEALTGQAGFQLARELRAAYSAGVPDYSISELARRLHTDRANLSRRITKAKMRSTA